MDIIDRIGQIENFWEREFAFYLNEHRNPLNRASHMVGIPVLLGTAVAGLATLNLPLIVGGQAVGWAIQLIGHRIEGNRPALRKRKISFLMGPLMVLVELLELLGMHFEFAQRARLTLGLAHA